MFGALVSQRFYHGYSLFTTCFACLSNSILIYSIIVSNVKHVGPYRFLLIGFAVVEILISLVHFVVMPGTHLTEFGCILWGYRTLNWAKEKAVWASMMWSMLFYQTFVLTAFHYVYRFVLVCNPHWLSWIQRKPWRNWITIATVYDVLFVCAISFVSYKGSHPDLYRKEWAPIMKDVYNIDLLAPSKPGFLGVLYWTINKNGLKQWSARSLVCILIIILVFSTSVIVLVYCLLRILKELTPNRLLAFQFRHTSNAETVVSRSSLAGMIRSERFKTIFPLFTSYIPVGFIFAAPLVTGVAFGGLGTIALMSTQIFPMVDPFIVLLFVQDYRKALPRFLQRAIQKTTEVTMGSRTSSVTMLMT